MTQPQGREDEPGGCLLCGVGERVHMSRWHPQAGQHTWEPPTTSQRLARMRARARNQAASRVRQVGQQQ